MPKVKLKTKGEVSSLVLNNFNGIETDFLVVDLPVEKQEKLICFLANLVENLTDFEVLYEGKINYGFRNKRIEIVLYQKPFLFLGEISDLKKLDKKALEMDKIIDNEKQNEIYQDIDIVGCLFTETDLSENILNNIESLVNNEFLFLNINDENVFELITQYVLSRQ